MEDLARLAKCFTDPSCGVLTATSHSIYTAPSSADTRAGYVQPVTLCVLLLQTLRPGEGLLTA